MILMAATVAAQEEDAPGRRSRDCDSPAGGYSPFVTGCPAPLRPPGLEMPPLPDSPLIKPDGKKRKKATTKKKKKPATKKKRRTRRDGKPRKKTSTKKKKASTKKKKKPAKKKPPRSASKSRDKSKKSAAKDTKIGAGKAERVRLIYTEKKKSSEASATAKDKTSDDCEVKGGLTPGMVCVGERIARGGGGGGGATGAEATEEEKLLKAHLQVAITPELISVDDGRAYKVILDVGARDMNVPSDLEFQSRLQALGDIALVMLRLRKWKRTLNAKETEELEEQGYITRPLVTPFRGLKKMRLAGPVNLTVRLRQEEMEIRLRFVRAVEDGFAAIDGKLRYGQQFFVEARFKKAPEEGERTVRLFYDDLPGARIKVARTADDEKLYRSKGYHLMYGYHDQP
jgi:outer membrane biosynthesis protein TonB